MAHGPVAHCVPYCILKIKAQGSLAKNTKMGSIGIYLPSSPSVCMGRLLEVNTAIHTSGHRHVTPRI